MSNGSLSTKSFTACFPLLLAYSKSLLTSVVASVPVDKLVNAASCFHGIVNTSSKRIHHFPTALMSSSMVVLEPTPQMLAKKLPVHTTPRVIKHPSLSHGKTSPNPMWPPPVLQSRLMVFSMVLSASFRPKGLRPPSERKDVPHAHPLTVLLYDHGRTI